MDEIKNLFQLKSRDENLKSFNLLLVENFLNEALDLIYPGMIRREFKTELEFVQFINEHRDRLIFLLEKSCIDKNAAIKIAEDYINQLKNISEKIMLDASAILNGDPAAKNIREVVLSYPGLLAIATYRLANFLYHKKIDVIPRLLSEMAHMKTGIDIHPGATIGDHFFIDHGTGIVIGETATIGKNVKIYQGVTLGALSVEKNLAGIKRHPTIKDNCVLYAHATILGGDTVVGECSIVGGNVWLTRSIPSHSVVYHQSIIKLDQKNSIDKNEELNYEI